MTAPDEAPAWRELVPLLDDALLSLREKDRTALLLRFQENKPLKEVGQSMGVGEDAAQKRVQNALERVAKFFRRHGHRTATGAIAATALQGTAQAAPAALLATTIQSTLVVAPATALSGLSLWLAHLTSLSKAKTALACLAVAAVPVINGWNENRVSEARLSEFRFQTATARQQAADLEASLAALDTEGIRWETELAKEEAALAERRLIVEKAETLKTRLLAYLGSEEPSWPDDLSFVKVPKRALTEIGFQVWDGTGRLTDEARGVLSISKDEALRMEASVAGFREGVSRLMVLSATEATDSKWFDTFSNPDAPRLVFNMGAPEPTRSELKDGFAREQATLLGSERQGLISRQSDFLYGGDVWSGVQTTFMEHGVVLGVGNSSRGLGKFVFATQEVVILDGRVDRTISRSWDGEAVGQFFPPEVTAVFTPWLQGITNKTQGSK